MGCNRTTEKGVQEIQRNREKRVQGKRKRLQGIWGYKVKGEQEKVGCNRAREKGVQEIYMVRGRGLQMKGGTE